MLSSSHTTTVTERVIVEGSVIIKNPRGRPPEVSTAKANEIELQLRDNSLLSTSNYCRNQKRSFDQLEADYDSIHFPQLGISDDTDCFFQDLRDLAQEHSKLVKESNKLQIRINYIKSLMTKELLDKSKKFALINKGISSLNYWGTKERLNKILFLKGKSNELNYSFDKYRKKKELDEQFEYSIEIGKISSILDTLPIEILDYIRLFLYFNTNHFIELLYLPPRMFHYLLYGSITNSLSNIKYFRIFPCFRWYYMKEDYLIRSDELDLSGFITPNGSFKSIQGSELFDHLFKNKFRS